MAVATGWAGEAMASPLFWNSVSLIATWPHHFFWNSVSLIAIWPHHNFKSNNGYSTDPLALYVSTTAGFAAYASDVNLASI